MAIYNYLLPISIFALWGYILNLTAYFLLLGHKECDCLGRLKIALKHLNSKHDKQTTLLNLLTIILSSTVFTASYVLIPQAQFLTSLIFFSALLVTIRTDLEYMLISEAMTLFLIPVGLILSYLGATWTTLPFAIAGTIIGYLSLYLVNKLFYCMTKKDGLGAGDMDLLAMVGSFTGLIGIWITILLGSISASIFGIACIIIKKDKQVKIPFGPFIASGAILFALLQQQILSYLLI